MISIRKGVCFRSKIDQLLFACLVTLMVTACSSGSDTANPITDVDPTTVLPGEIPIINVPVVEPPAAEFTPPADQTQSVFDLLSATGTFTRLLALLESASLVEQLQGDAPLTLFAPDDDAFAALDLAIGANTIGALNPDQLRDQLTYHLVNGVVLDSTALGRIDGQALAMANELPAAINFNENGELLINSSILTGADMFASNGVVHTINNVLTPPLRPADPNDSIPPPTTDSISVTLLERSDYSTLLALIETADLAQLLQEDNDGQGWTLFAPSDSAFERSSDDVFGLNMEDATDLINLYLYSGTLESSELEDGPLAMRNGSVLVERSATGVVVGGATIVGRDRVVGNGIIHFVDAPLAAIAN